MRMFKTLLANLLIVSSIVMLSSCQKENQAELLGEAEVTLQKLSTDKFSKMRILFTPSESAKSVQFAIGNESDREAFKNGILEGIMQQDGNQPFEYVFEDLDSDEEYTVFAVAYDENGKAGSVTSVKNTPILGDVNLELQYCSDVSAGFKYTCSTTIASCRYYLGTEADREAFLNEEVESKVFADIYEEYTVNFFDLEPSKEYVLFAIVEDLSGVKTELVEIPFTTNSADDDFPDLSKDIEVVFQDAYGAKVKVFPNDMCGKIVCSLAPKGEYDWNIDQWQGDILGMFEFKSGTGELPSSKDGAELQVEYTDKTISYLDVEFDLYVMFSDNNYNPVSVKKYTLPAFVKDENAGVAECVSAEVSEILPTSVTFEITLNDNAVGAYYNVFDGVWYDEQSQSETGEFWQAEMLLQDIKDYFVYGKKTFEYKDTTVKGDKYYYLIVCPFNKNGVQGWGPVFEQKFETPAA